MHGLEHRQEIRPVARPAGGGGPKFQNEIFRPWRELGEAELGKSGQNIYSEFCRDGGPWPPWPPSLRAWVKIVKVTCPALITPVKQMDSFELVGLFVRPSVHLSRPFYFVRL